MSLLPGEADPAEIEPDRMDVRRFIEEAETFEFRHKDYSQAEKLYRTALDRTLDYDIKAELLTRLARVSVRQGDMNTAMEIYAMVADRYSQNRLQAGMPAGLAARLELAGLMIRREDYSTTGELLLELYQELLKA